MELQVFKRVDSSTLSLAEREDEEFQRSAEQVKHCTLKLGTHDKSSQRRRFLPRTPILPYAAWKECFAS